MMFKLNRKEFGGDPSESSTILRGGFYSSKYKNYLFGLLSLKSLKRLKVTLAKSIHFESVLAELSGQDILRHGLGDYPFIMHKQPGTGGAP